MSTNFVKYVPKFLNKVGSLLATEGTLKIQFVSFHWNMAEALPYLKTTSNQIADNFKMSTYMYNPRKVLLSIMRLSHDLPHF